MNELDTANSLFPNREIAENPSRWLNTINTWVSKKQRKHVAALQNATISHHIYSTTLSNFILRNWISFPRILTHNLSIQRHWWSIKTKRQDTTPIDRQKKVHNKILRSVVVAIHSTFDSKCFGIRMTMHTHHPRSQKRRRKKPSATQMFQL